MKTTREPCTYATEFAQRMTEKFHQPENIRHNHVSSFTVIAGVKYDKVVIKSWIPDSQRDNEATAQRSVHAHIERETGLLCKSAGWSGGPAKNSKGALLSKFDLSTFHGMNAAITAADPYGGYLYSR